MSNLDSNVSLCHAFIIGYNECFRFTGPGCMSTNTIIVTCNAVLSLLATFLTLLPCTKKTTGGVVPAALQAAIGRAVVNHVLALMNEGNLATTHIIR